MVYREIKTDDEFYESIFKNEFGKFKVTHINTSTLGGSKYKVYFLDSGNTVYCSKKMIANKTVKDAKTLMGKSIIGMKLKSNEYNEFTVLGRSSIKKRGDALYEIEFDECMGVKYRTLSTKNNLINGRVKNPYFPKIYGVGYIAEPEYKDNKIYNIWKLMLKRCYDKNSNEYKYYGAKNVYVSSRWHNFDLFQKDYLMLDGYKEDASLFLDKDILCEKLNIHPKVYSPKTCILVNSSESSIECRRRNNQYKFKAINPQGEEFISDNQTEFAKEHGLTFSYVNRSLNKRGGGKNSRLGWSFIKMK